MKGNFKVLSEKNLATYVAKYSFELKGDTLLVLSLGRDGSTRVTAHQFGEDFPTSIRDEEGRFKQNLGITKEAQLIWRDHFPTENLGQIQNIINELRLSNVEVTEENIRAKLN